MASLWATVLVALAMIPALVLVAANRYGGRRGLLAAAALLCAAIIEFFLRVEGPLQWSTIVLLILPFVASTATIVAGIGGTSMLRQTMAAAAALVLAPAIPLLIIVAVADDGPVRLLAVAGIALALYLILRRWMAGRRSTLYMNDVPR